eukprot:3636403-Prymnesium_polylepis.1
MHTTKRPSQAPLRLDTHAGTGDVTPHRCAFASRNCVISGANPCELVRTLRESVANFREHTFSSMVSQPTGFAIDS